MNLWATLRFAYFRAGFQHMDFLPQLAHQPPRLHLHPQALLRLRRSAWGFGGVYFCGSRHAQSSSGVCQTRNAERLTW